MIHIRNPHHGRRIAKKAGTVFHETDVTISRVKNGELLGGVIFTGYTGASVGIHVASWSDKWVSRNMIYMVFDYAFNRLKVRKIVGQVPSYNKAAIEFDLNVGFKQETIVKDVFPDGDMLVLSMYKEDCRLLRVKPRNLEADVVLFGR